MQVKAKQARDAQPGEVIVYALGIMALSACAPASMEPEDVQAEVNRLEPTGISAPWALDNAPRFKGGEPNPGPCDQEPDCRTHYLFAC